MTTRYARQVDVDDNEKLATVAKRTLQIVVPITFGISIAAGASAHSIKWAFIGLVFFAGGIIVGASSAIANQHHGQPDPGHETIGYLGIIAAWIIAFALSIYFVIRGESGWWPWGTFCVASAISTWIFLETRIWQES